MEAHLFVISSCVIFKCLCECCLDQKPCGISQNVRIAIFGVIESLAGPPETENRDFTLIASLARRPRGENHDSYLDRKPCEGENRDSRLD